MGSEMCIRDRNNIYDIRTPEDHQLGRITVTPTPAGVSADSDFGFSEDIDFTYPVEPYVVSGYVEDGYFEN